ncbi:MAG: hypothetical protein MJ137_03970 [Clostridia bacterium]|nr:hypothetical protein [Clostridia bacterium]
MKNTEKKEKHVKNSLRTVTLCILLTALLLPFVFCLCSLLFLPEIYGETFLGELPDKFALIKNTKEPKIVVIGGSSTAFGLDSAVIERETGMKTVNFGLYATLGTKLMLDLAEDYIGKGDIVVLAPELDAQTLSLYFNAEAAWQGIEGDLSMLFHVGKSDIGKLAGGFFGYIGKRWEYTLSGRTLSPGGIYRHDSFNGYGDISAAREYNVMTYGYDKSQTIELTESIVSPDFIDYLNRFIDIAKLHGADVYFGFCPVNRDALAPSTTGESVKAFTDFLGEKLHCGILGSPWDSIMDSGYFYDTNFHLNDAGVTVHTAVLVNDILRETGSGKSYSLRLPEPPGKKPADTPVIDPSVVDPFENYFEYEEFGGSITITGVKEDARLMTSLEIPKTVKGMPVTVLAKGSLSSCSQLSSLTIRENLTLIEDGAFEGCTALVSVHMRREEADDLEVSANVFSGASGKLTIYLYTQSSYDSFFAGYWWAHHSSRMKLVTD